MLKKIPHSLVTIKAALLVVLLSYAPTLLAQTLPAAQKVTLVNPLKVASLEDLLVAILNIIVVIAIPIIVMFIIYSGFLYVTAKGNASQVEQATRSLTYAIIGAVFIIGAVAIAEIVRNLVTSF